MVKKVMGILVKFFTICISFCLQESGSCVLSCRTAFSSANHFLQLKTLIMTINTTQICTVGPAQIKHSIALLFSQTKVIRHRLDDNGYFRITILRASIFYRLLLSIGPTLLYLSFNLNTCTKVLAYVQHNLDIAGFLLQLKSICIKHSNLNTTSPITTPNLLICIFLR